MTSFLYLARSRDGKTVRGVRGADSEAALARDLALESLFLLRTEPPKTATGRFRGPRVKRVLPRFCLRSLRSFISSLRSLAFMKVSYARV